MSSVHALFRRLETIGKGAYGSVHKAVHISSGNVVALKIINFDEKNAEAYVDVQDIQREVALLTELRDAPNITKYYGCYLDGPRIWIVMEYAQGGSVYSLMKASPGGCIEEKYATVITREVLLGLSYLHKSNIIHRDIKAANVLITAIGKVVLCDFGVAARLATSSSKRNTMMGTLLWMAPEVVATTPLYDTKADIWSLGIMIHEMIKGAPPHANNTDVSKTIDLISRNPPPRLSEADGSREMKDFVSFCLKERPSERPTAEELGKSKWIKTAAKTPVSVLRDLIIRYDNFIAEKGPRASLAVPLDWEEDESLDTLNHRPISAEHLWEFETLKGRINPYLFENPRDDSKKDNLEENEGETIRASAPVPVPTSLRNLFKEESCAPVKSPELREGGRSAPPLSSPVSALPLLPDRVLPKRSATTDEIPLPSSRPPPVPPLGPGIPRRKTSESATSDSSSATTAVPPSASFRDEYFSRSSGEGGSPSSVKTDNRTDSEESPSGKRKLTYIRPPIRKATSTAALAEEQMSSIPSAPTEKAIENSVSSMRRLNLTPVPTKTAFSAAGQNFSYPIDVPDSAGLKPRPITVRSRSATSSISESAPFPAKQPSLPTTGWQRMLSSGDEPLVPPIKPFAQKRMRSESSGSESAAGVPSLKDVLKVPSLSSEHHLGIADLLPPSPAPVFSASRTFLPSPGGESNTSGKETLAAVSSSIPPVPHTGTPVSPIPGFPLDNAGPASFTEATTPLPDFQHLIADPEMVQFHLAKTLDDLSSLLSTVESGLATLLDDTIKEEQQNIALPLRP